VVDVPPVTALVQEAIVVVVAEAAQEADNPLILQR